MEIQLTMAEALSIAEQTYGGASDVLTITRQPQENITSLVWWQTDKGRRIDRGWRGRRDCAALVTYHNLSRYAVQAVPSDEFPTEFLLADGAWCRPDKDIIKQGLRCRCLIPISTEEKLTGFRIAEHGLWLVQQFFHLSPQTDSPTI